MGATKWLQQREIISDNLLRGSPFDVAQASWFYYLSPTWRIAVPLKSQDETNTEHLIYGVHMDFFAKSLCAEIRALGSPNRCAQDP